MATNIYDTETPQSLEECQDFIFAIMNDVENIWSKLQASEWPAHVKSHSEFEQWRLKALAAKRHKENRLKWLQAFCMDNFNCSYPTKRALLLAIQEREMREPAFLQDEQEYRFIDAKTAKQVEKAVQAAIINKEPERPEIVLSAQAQKQLEGIMARLKAARIAAGLTQLEASEALGFESEVVGHYERLRNSPTILNIFHLCQIYQVDALEILTGKIQYKREDLETIAGWFGEGAEYIRQLLNGERD